MEIKQGLTTHKQHNPYLQNSSLDWWCTSVAVQTKVRRNPKEKYDVSLCVRHITGSYHMASQLT